MDYAWTGPGARLQTQIEKYHAFFANRIDNEDALYLLNGAVAGWFGYEWAPAQ